MADVICPNCGDRFHETTDAYRPGVITTGNMIRLKRTYVENGWSSFPEYESTSFGDMDCPGCGGLYSDNGRVRIDEEQYAKEPKPIEVKLETLEAIMKRLMDEYEPELPTIKKVDYCLSVYSKEELDKILYLYKKGLYVDVPEEHVAIIKEKIKDAEQKMREDAARLVYGLDMEEAQVEAADDFLKISEAITNDIKSGLFSASVESKFKRKPGRPRR